MYTYLIVTPIGQYVERADCIADLNIKYENSILSIINLTSDVIQQIKEEF